MVPPYVLSRWVRVSVGLLWCDVILAESRRGECNKCVCCVIDSAPIHLLV